MTEDMLINNLVLLQSRIWKVKHGFSQIAIGITKRCDAHYKCDK